MRHFLLIYDHNKRVLLARQEFTESIDATSAYAAAEQEHEQESDVEIVLVGADSIETIERTHGHYFDTSAHQLDRYLTPA